MTLECCWTMHALLLHSSLCRPLGQVFFSPFHDRIPLWWTSSNLLWNVANMHHWNTTDSEKHRSAPAPPLFSPIPTQTHRNTSEIGAIYHLIAFYCLTWVAWYWSACTTWTASSLLPPGHPTYHQFWISSPLPKHPKCVSILVVHKSITETSALNRQLLLFCEWANCTNNSTLVSHSSISHQRHTQIHTEARTLTDRQTLMI